MKTKYLDLFEKYSNGEMSSAETAIFKQQLEENPDLAADYKEYREIMEALNDTETLGLLEKLREIRDSEEERESKRRFLNSGNNWFWLAALLTIAVGFTIVISLLIRELNFDESEARKTVAAQQAKAQASLNAELLKYAMRKNALTFITPSDSSSYIAKGDILFAWTVDSTYNLLMDVLDYKGHIMFKSYRPVESPFFFSERLKDGFYIFRFRDDKETFGLVSMYVIQK